MVIVQLSYITIINSQYYEFPYEGWKQSLIRSEWNGSQFVETLSESMYQKDSIVDNKNYKVIKRGPNILLFRYENGKVYERGYVFNGTTNDPVDELMFDFTLSVGDTIPVWPFLPVSKKERLLINQDSLWYIEIQQDQWNAFKWLEGVGEMNAGLASKSGIEVGFKHVCTLNNYKQTIAENDDLYTQTNYDCAYIHGIDADNDGVRANYDCDDSNPDINPAVAEQPYNGIDDDCNAATFDDDLDQDGFLMVDDCDDNDSDINPDAEEIPNNGIDEDCDGMDLVSSTFDLAGAKVNIYPNPTSDIINIDIEGHVNFKTIVYDLNGKVVKSNTNSKKIHVFEMASGIYLLEIEDLNSGQRIMERMIIE